MTIEGKLSRLANPNPAIRNPRVNRRRGKIAHLTYLNGNTIKLVLAISDTKPPLHAQAGQFCTIQVPGIDKPRAFSLARAPQAERPGEHTFLIKLVDDGQFSRWIKRSNRLGEIVELSGPLGKFTLGKATSPMVCIAGGSGISAIFSILEHTQLAATGRDCYFFYGAKTAQELCLVEEIESLQQSWHPSFNFEFVPVLSEPSACDDWQGLTGYVGEVAISKLLSDTQLNLSTSEFYLCGPPRMIDATVENLHAAGVPPNNCHFDRFENAYGPAPRIDNQRCVLCDECLLVKPIDDCIVESIASGHASLRRISPSLTSGLYYNALVIDENRCIRCQACIEACPHGAISTQFSTSTHTLRQPGDH